MLALLAIYAFDKPPESPTRNIRMLVAQALNPPLYGPRPNGAQAIEKRQVRKPSTRRCGGCGSTFLLDMYVISYTLLKVGASTASTRRRTAGRSDGAGRLTYWQSYRYRTPSGHERSSPSSLDITTPVKSRSPTCREQQRPSTGRRFSRTRRFISDRRVSPLRAAPPFLPDISNVERAARVATQMPMPPACLRPVSYHERLSRMGQRSSACASLRTL
jgi:hypothetical protein